MNSWMWNEKLKYKEKLLIECLHYSIGHLKTSKSEKSFTAGQQQYLSL